MKKIVCDCDGCILDFAFKFSEWWNLDHFDLISGTPTSWDFGVKDTKALYEGVVEFQKSKNFESIPYLFPDTEKFFNILSEKYKIIIVSATPLFAEESRKKNLENLRYNKLILKPEKKIEYIINNIRPSIAIEDKPEYIKQLASCDIQVYYPKIKLTEGKGLENYGFEFNSWSDLHDKLERVKVSI